MVFHGVDEGRFTIDCVGMKRGKEINRSGTKRAWDFVLVALELEGFR